MAKHQLPSPEVLRQLLRYEPETGRLFWKEEVPEELFRSRQAFRVWQSRCPGKEAFLAKHDFGYLQGKIFGVLHFAHSVAWAIHHGEAPPGLIDHANGNGADNRAKNLRDATPLQNLANTKLPRANTSGLKGVSWRASKGRWRATIREHGRHRHLGYFDDPLEAAAAYDRAALELHGEFARTNAMVTASEKPSTDRGRQARD